MNGGAGDMGNNINLSNLNDIQKAFLTQISYLDINVFGIRKCKNVGIRVGDIQNFLVSPSCPFCGSAGMSKQVFDKITKLALGDHTLPTNAELHKNIVKHSLDELTIIDAASDAKSGFQATAFKDAFGNIGISYRGSDFDFANGGLMDWFSADFFEYFTNDSTQRHQAIDFFKKWMNPNGQNYLYGHSLGGNLASYVYLEYYDKIAETFIVNGYPINSILINTDEKIAAFNSSKYICNSIYGDVVSHLKSCDPYRNNVRLIKNNKIFKFTPASAHLIQSATVDDFGNYVKATNEEFNETMAGTCCSFTRFSQKLRNVLNELDHERHRANIRRT